MVDINIQNGQGITQAIKAKLLNDGLINKDTKISASVWNQIIQEVQTQNNQNVQSGKASFYSGGSDIKGAASKNFVVKSGVMELTQEAWNNICSLFGGVPKDVQPQSSAQSPVPDVVSEAETQVKAEQPTFDFAAQIAPTTFMDPPSTPDVAGDIQADAQSDISLNNGPAVSDVDDNQSAAEDPYVKKETVIDENGVQLTKETKGAVTTYKDSSGMVVIKMVDKGTGGIVETQFEYNDETGKLDNETIFSPDGTSCEVHYYDEDGNLISLKEINTLDENGYPIHTDSYDGDDLISKADYERDVNGNIKSAVTQFYTNDKISSIDHDTYTDGYITHTDSYAPDDKTLLSKADFVNDEDGNTTSRTTKFYKEDGKTVSSIDVDTYQDGNIVHTDRYASDGTTIESATDFENDEEGNTISGTTKFYKEDGKTVLSITVDRYENENVVNKICYEADGEKQTSVTHFEYDEKGNVNHQVIHDLKNNKKCVYEGIHAQNDNGMPSEEIVYDTDRTTIKERIVREFGELGELKSVSRLDRDGNLLSYQDDFKLDGKFETAYQGTGDCYLLAAINSLAITDKGQEFLRQNRSVSQDENGQNVYTIKFPGAEAASKDLKTRLPEDKVYIKGSYTVTQAELDQAISDMELSKGDPDVLLYEIAYSKYREDVQSTVEDNDINMQDALKYAGLTVVDKDNLIEGGFGEEAIFILTGNKSDSWSIKDYDSFTTGIYLDNNAHEVKVMNNVTIEESKIKVDPNKEYISLSGFMEIAQYSFDEESRNQIIEKLIKDAQDGKLDANFATASFNVAYSENAVSFGGHAVAIVDINNDYVTIVDSNDNTSVNNKRGEYKIPMADFLAACTGITINNFD